MISKRKQTRMNELYTLISSNVTYIKHLILTSKSTKYRVKN